jgi:hypothetical protein
MQEDDDLAAELAAEAVRESPEEAPKPTLERMQQLAAEVNDIDDRIAKNQARIDELNERRNAILNAELVELMDTAHVQSLQVGGRKFQPQPYYKAVIPAENPGPGLDWLEANEAGDLIKNLVIGSFPRGCEDDARLAADLMQKRFQMATVSRERSVHWMTLTKWLKELHQSGDSTKTLPPLDIIGGIIGRVVKISNVKD